MAARSNSSRSATCCGSEQHAPTPALNMYPTMALEAAVSALPHLGWANRLNRDAVTHACSGSPTRKLWYSGPICSWRNATIAAAVPARWLRVAARVKRAHKCPTADCRVNEEDEDEEDDDDDDPDDRPATPILMLELRIVFRTAD